MTRHVEVNAPMQRRERWGALACARGERPGPGDHTKTNTRARRPRSTNVAKQVEEGPSDKREKNPQTQPLPMCRRYANNVGGGAKHDAINSKDLCRTGLVRVVRQKEHEKMTRHVEVNAPMQRRERWGALACARGERPGPGDHTKTNTRARRPRSTNVAKQVEEGPSDKREKNPQTQPLPMCRRYANNVGGGAKHDAINQRISVTGRLFETMTFFLPV